MKADTHGYHPGRSLIGTALVGLGLLAAVPAFAQSNAGSANAARSAASDLSPATIRALQHSLIQGGYDVDATDGVWGPKTAAAVREFQRIKGIEANGRPDARTLAALGVAANGTAPAGLPKAALDKSPPVRARTPADLDRATVRAVQGALDKQGLQAGPVDGIWGEKTVSAIGNFQRARGLPASGELDAHTLAAMGLLPGGTEPHTARRPGVPPGPADLNPATIRMIQQSLQSSGHQIGTPDGIWGDKTVSALRDFQRSQGIEPTGEPDVYTLVALGLLPGADKRSTARR